jgi:hypothetical protein
MTGSIDKIDPHIPPVATGRGGGDGYAALLLLLHPVHDSRTVMHFAETMTFTGIKQNPFGNGGLAGIDVGDDSHVAQVLEFLPGHDTSRQRSWFQFSFNRDKSSMSRPLYSKYSRSSSST